MEAIQTVELPEVETDASGAAITETWRVEDMRTADWALMRLAECQSEAEEIDAQAKDAIARIHKRAAELKAKCERGASFFRFKLTEFAEMHRDELLKGKAKSRAFVHGVIKFRSSSARLEVVDPKALAEWLSCQPPESGLYRVKVEPEMKALQDLFKTNGEIPPGCDQKIGTESITIEAIAPERALKE